MKRMFALLTALLLCATLAVNAEETGTVRMDMEFGLFSMEIPADLKLMEEGGNMLHVYRYLFDGPIREISGNYDTIDSYDDTAARALESQISMVYAVYLGGEIEEYSETEIAEEKLEDGSAVRWQLMRTPQVHALWFEVKTDNFGYNGVIIGSAGSDERMLAMMRSFRADVQIELDIAQCRQTQNGDGTFTSCEHGLKIAPDAEWNAIAYEQFLTPGATAFALEKNDAVLMIQLFHSPGVAASQTSDVLTWFAQMRGQAADDPQTVVLEGLDGVEALVTEEDTEITCLDVAFVYKGHGYYGVFMCMPDETGANRVEIETVLHSITPAD